MVIIRHRNELEGIDTELAIWAEDAVLLAETILRLTPGGPS